MQDEKIHAIGEALRAGTLVALLDVDGTVSPQYCGDAITPNGAVKLECLHSPEMALRGPRIPKEMIERNNALVQEYMPLERSPDVTPEKKKELMREWWEKRMHTLHKDYAEYIDVPAEPGTS